MARASAQPLTPAEEAQFKELKVKVTGTTDENGVFTGPTDQEFKTYLQLVNKKNAYGDSKIPGQVAADAAADEGCAWYKLFCVTDIINNVLNALFVFIYDAIGLLITLGAAFIALIIDMSKGINDNPMIAAGFKVTLGLANLGFVLAIIMIAYTTILRLEGYETKKLLRNLIIAAVLVNFSRLIAGVVIDFSNVIAFGFMDQITSLHTGELGSALASTLHIQAYNQVGGGAAIAKTGANILTGLISLVIAIIFSVLTLIIFLGIGIMLLVRYVYITILIILMPLAWLFWTVPQYAGLWKKWWDKFLQWNFFLPAVSFFLFLAINTSVELSKFVKAGSSSPSGSAFSTSVNQPSGTAGFLNALVMMGLFVGSLIAGNAMGITGAGVALGAAKGAAKGIGKWTGSKTGRYLDRKLGGKNEKGERPGLTGRLAQRLNKFRGVPGVKGAVAGLERIRGQKAETEEYQKNQLGVMADDTFDKMPIPKDAVGRSAYMAEAIKRKKMKNLTRGADGEQLEGRARTDRLKLFADAAKQTNSGTNAEDIPAIKEILTANPTLAYTLAPGQKDNDGNDLSEEDTIIKAVQKTEAAKVVDWSAETFTDKTAVSGMTQGQITFVLRNGGDKAEILRNTLKQVASEDSPDMSDTIEEIERLRTEQFQMKETNQSKSAIKQNQKDLAAAYAKKNALVETVKKKIGAAQAAQASATDASQKAQEKTTEKKLKRQLASLDTLKNLNQKNGFGDYTSY